jgi:hypothetical protein
MVPVRTGTMDQCFEHAMTYCDGKDVWRVVDKQGREIGTFQRHFEYMGVEMVHCGDDWWRPYDNQGKLQWEHRFTNRSHIEEWVRDMSVEDMLRYVKGVQ